VRIVDLAVSRCLNSGIELASSSVVERCTVTTAGFRGIDAGIVLSSNCFETGYTAISAKVCRDSVGQAVTDGTGIQADTVVNSDGFSASGAGVSASNVENSYGTSSSGSGIVASAINSRGSSSSGVGILGALFNASATGCYGSGTTGIAIETVMSCAGLGTTGPGVHAQLAESPSRLSTESVVQSTEEQPIFPLPINFSARHRRII